MCGNDCAAVPGCLNARLRGYVDVALTPDLSGVAALLDGCSRLCAPLFKRFCASDGDGKSRGGTLPKQKFELCLRRLHRF